MSEDNKQDKDYRLILIRKQLDQYYAVDRKYRRAIEVVGLELVDLLQDEHSIAEDYLDMAKSICEKLKGQMLL